MKLTGSVDITTENRGIVKTIAQVPKLSNYELNNFAINIGTNSEPTNTIPNIAVRLKRLNFIFTNFEYRLSFLKNILN